MAVRSRDGLIKTAPTDENRHAARKEKSYRAPPRINVIQVDLFPLNMIPYSTLVAMAAVGTSPMPVLFALIIFNQPEVVRLDLQRTAPSTSIDYID